MLRQTLLSTGALLLAPLAHAQSTDPRGLPAPNYEAVDSNHVDLGSGRLAFDYPGPSIGPRDLKLDLTYLYLLESPSSTNLTGRVEKGNPIVQMGPSPFTVTLGKRTAVFLVTTNGNVYPYKVRGGESFAFGGGGIYASHAFTDRDGTVAVFSVAASNPERWYVSSLTKPTGEQLTFSYDISPYGVPMLKKVVSSAGFAINIAANSVTAYNMAVDYCPPATATCAYSTTWPSMQGGYGYLTDNMGRQLYISAGTFAAQFKTPEQVSSGSGVTNITYGQQNSGGSYFVYGNFNINRVTSIQTPSGTWNYTYATEHITYHPDLPPPELSKYVWAKRTAPDGGVLEVRTYAGGMYYRKDELGRESNGVVEQDVNYEGRVKEVTLPGGNKLTYTYDGRGNITQVLNTPKPGSNLAATTQIASFPATCSNRNTCNQPDYIIDANANRTDFSYHAWGGIKSELGPGVNGVRPLKRWEYVQLTAYVKDASGALVPAGAPIWRPSREIVCKETINAALDGCANAADEVVTQYEYGAPGTANSLWLRGIVMDATGTPARTCYSYDKFGNRISETRPRAGLATCN